VKPDCPFCSSHDCELVSQFGGQIITAQWRCRSCGSYFEALREEFDDATGSQAPSAASTSSPT